MATNWNYDTTDRLVMAHEALAQLHTVVNETTGKLVSANITAQIQMQLAAARAEYRAAFKAMLSES